MANQRKNISAQKSINKPVTTTTYTADDYYSLYDQTVQEQPARTLHIVAIPLSLFGVFGLLWAIPFPHLSFLSTYNGFFNWASFLLAIMIYFYLRLAPTVSYLILFFLLICAYGVVQLSAWQVLGGPPLWVICGIFFLAATVTLTISGSRTGVSNKAKLFAAAPLWFIYNIIHKKPKN